MTVYCPECGEPIERLRRDYEGDINVCAIDAEGEEEVIDIVDGSFSPLGPYYCPSCFEHLAQNEEEALELLNTPELESRIDEMERNGELEVR